MPERDTGRAASREASARTSQHLPADAAAASHPPNAEAARHYLAAIVDSSDDAILSKTLDGIITSWNASAERLYGYTAEEAVGRPVSLIIPPERKAELPTIMERLRRGQRIEQLETIRVHKDGTRIAISLTVSPIRDDAGRLIGASAIARDITEQKRSAEMMRFLANATFMLAETLDYETTLTRIAELIVPSFADWCTIDLLDDGTLRQVAVAHADPDKVELGQRVRRQYPPRMEATHGTARVLRTGQAEVVPEITDEMLAASAQDEEHLRILRRLGLRSGMVVPLTARGRTLGAISLLAAETGRRYTEADLPPIEELARSSALAIDNARLFQEAQHEIAERRRAEEEVERLNRNLQHRLGELQTLLDVAPVGIAVASDPACRYITSNPALSEMLGIPHGVNPAREGPEGDRLPFRILRDGHELPSDALPMKHAATHGVVIRGQELDLEHEDGSHRTLLEYAAPLYDEHQQVRGAVGALVDITERKQLERTLLASERRFRQLADAMPQIVWISDARGRPTFVNAQWRAYTGLTLEQTQDPDQLRRIVHPDDEPALFDQWQRSVSRETTYEVEYRLRQAADDTFRWFLARSVPIRDDRGQIKEWFGTATDIDDYKRAETRLREQRHTLATLNEINTALAAELDLDRLLQAVTDAATELSGAAFGAFFYNADPAPGDPHAEGDDTYRLYTLSGASREAFADFPMPRSTAIFEPTFKGEAVVRLDDVMQDPRFGQHAPHYGFPAGHLPVRSYLAAPVVSRTGEVLGGLFLGHDEAGVFTEEAEQLVTGIAGQAATAVENARLYHAAQAELAERKRAEQQLTELNETLEERVAERTAALEEANTRLQGEVQERLRAERELEKTNTTLVQRNRELQEFAYVASHDLQEPLRKISSFVDLLREDYGGAVDEMGQLYMERMRSAALRMSQLIHDLLSFSRIATRGQPFQPVDLRALIAEVLSDLEVALAETQGQVDVAELPTLHADPMQMRQLFQNLISNALKFHRADEPPLVRIHAHRLDDDDAPDAAVYRIVVADNGIGFEEKYLDRIFSPFQRLHGRSAYPGTGIGLAICRRIAERHHGTISARSTPDEGATFFIDLPANPPDDDLPA